MNAVCGIYIYRGQCVFLHKWRRIEKADDSGSMLKRII